MLHFKHQIKGCHPAWKRYYKSLKKGFHHYKRYLQKRFYDNNHWLNLAETAFQIKGRKNFYSLKLTPLQLQAEQIYKGTIYAELKSGNLSICTGIHSRGEIKNYILRI